MAKAARPARAARKPHGALHEICERIARLHQESLEVAIPTRVEQTARKWLARLDLQAKDDAALKVVATAMGLAIELESFTPSHSGVLPIDRLARQRKFDADEEIAAQALRQARFTIVAVRRPLEADLFEAEDLGTGRAFTLFFEDLPTAALGKPLATWLCRLADDRLGSLGVVVPLDDAGLAVAKDFIRPGRGIANGPRCAAAVYRHAVRNGGPIIVGVNDLPDGPDEGEEEDASPLDEIAAGLIANGTWRELPRAIEDEVRRLGSPLDLLECLFKAAGAQSAGVTETATLYRRFAELMIESLHLRVRAGMAPGGFSLDAMAGIIDREVATSAFPHEAADLFREIRRGLTAGKAREADEDLTRVIERIRGLRAKTIDQGCTEEEALSAADKVAELLDRYGLSLGEIDLREQTCFGIGIGSRRKRIGAVDDVAPDIARFCDCKSWFERTADGTMRTVFFGLPADVEAARYLHERVGQAFETETAAFRRGDLYAGLAGGRRQRATTSFQLGLSRGIGAKLVARKAERDTKTFAATGRDLVPVKSSIVEDEFARLGLSLESTAAGGSRAVLLKAFEAGQVAAVGFEIASELAAQS